MASRRCDLVDPLNVQILHVYNRCVRRAFLCGVDSVSGKDYSHRKEWLQQRMEFLVGIFAFDIATFAIMSNHFHIVLRSRPDIVRSWSDEEVVLRNLRLQGKTWFRDDGSERKSTRKEVERILSDPDEVVRIRRKLSDVSSLMAYFDEHIAKRSNREDQVKGAFWEGTFGAELIEDEESLLACMAYVDLNPIRAMMATTLEESDYTGAFHRINELRSHLATEEAVDPCMDQVNPESKAPSTLSFERTRQSGIGWLAPVEIDERSDVLDLDPSGLRPSRKGFLPISLFKYLEVVEWAGRTVRSDKRGSVPEQVPPIFDRLGFTSQGFLKSMLGFSKREPYFSATERQGKPEENFANAVGVG